jgi:nucleotide-binding universal stress UspA family protein
MYDRILVPLDGSKLAEAAIPFVEEIISGAKEGRQIEITLLQVIPGRQEVVAAGGGWPSGGVVRIPYSEAELEQIKKPVLDYLNKVGEPLQKGPHVTVRTLVRAGDDPAEQILRASDEFKIDLIALSTHGRSGITRWAFGSVADKILRGGNTPVFMVRAPVSRKE